MTLRTAFLFGKCVLPLLALAFLLTGTSCFAQRDYIGKYDAYVGFSDIYAPYVNNLNQPGVGVQFGAVQNRWLSSGFDYSYQVGTGSLTTGLLTKTLQMHLAAALPPGYNFSLPTDVNIQSFAAGTQLTYRRFAGVPLFFHPVLTAFRIAATPRPADPIAASIAHALVPSGTKTDWSAGYGAAGGADIRVSKHMSARVQFAAAWAHPMNDILGNGGWLYRMSIGPSFSFGRDINRSR